MGSMFPCVVSEVRLTVKVGKKKSSGQEPNIFLNRMKKKSETKIDDFAKKLV